MKKTSKRPETRRSLRRMVGHGCVYKLRTRICGDDATHHNPKHPMVRYCYAHAMSVGRYQELEVLPNDKVERRAPSTFAPTPGSGGAS